MQSKGLTKAITSWRDARPIECENGSDIVGSKYVN